MPAEACRSRRRTCSSSTGWATRSARSTATSAARRAFSARPPPTAPTRRPRRRTRDTSHVTYELDPYAGWMPDVEDIRNKVRYNDSIAGILLLSPDNPTGAVYPREIARGDRGDRARARHLHHRRRDLRQHRLQRRRAASHERVDRRRAGDRDAGDQQGVPVAGRPLRLARGPEPGPGRAPSTPTSTVSWRPSGWRYPPPRCPSSRSRGSSAIPATPTTCSGPAPRRSVDGRTRSWRPSRGASTSS
jgi:hypothetical protein